MRSIKKINKSHIKRNSIAASIVAVLIVGGVASALFVPGSPFALNHVRVADNPENTIDYGKPTPGQQAAGDQSKQEFNNKVYGNSSGGSGTTGDTGAGSGGSSQGSAASVTISSANQNNGTLQVRTIISEVTTTGNCKLSLEQAGQKTITQSAGTQALGSYSVCQGFDVSTAGMAKGQWKISITYTDQAGKTSSATQTVEI